MAGHKQRKTVIAYVLEQLTAGSLAYGGSATPTVSPVAAATSIVIIDPEITPIVGDYKDLNQVRDVMGGSKRIQTGRHSEFKFKAPISPIKAASGTNPPWGDLLRACGFARTIDNYYSLYRQITAAVGKGVAVLPLVKASDLLVGDLVSGYGIANGTTVTAINGLNVTLSTGLTAACGKGQQFRFYRDKKIVATSAATAIGSDLLHFAASPGVPIGTAVSGAGIPAGSYVVAYYGGDVRISNPLTAALALGANVQFDYKRCWFSTVSDGHEYLTGYTYADKILHTHSGVRGNVKLMLSAGEIPMFEFSYKGLYNEPKDASPAAASYVSWAPPIAIGAKETEVYYAGVPLNVSKLELDIGNEVKYRNLTGAEDIQIVDRKAKGSITWECDKIAAYDWFDHVNKTLTAPLCFYHGGASGGGNFIQVIAEALSMSDIKYEIVDGVYFFSAELSFEPTDASADIWIEAF